MKWASYLYNLCICVLVLSALGAPKQLWLGNMIQHKVCQTPSWPQRHILIISSEREKESLQAVAGYVSTCSINHKHSYTLKQLVHSEVTYNIMSLFRYAPSDDNKSSNVEKMRKLTVPLILFAEFFFHLRNQIQHYYLRNFRKSTKMKGNN